MKKYVLKAYFLNFYGEINVPNLFPIFKTWSGRMGIIVQIVVLAGNGEKMG